MLGKVFKIIQMFLPNVRLVSTWAWDFSLLNYSTRALFSYSLYIFCLFTGTFFAPAWGLRGFFSLSLAFDFYLKTDYLIRPILKHFHKTKANKKAEQVQTMRTLLISVENGDGDYAAIRYSYSVWPRPYGTATQNTVCCRLMCALS